MAHCIAASAIRGTGHVFWRPAAGAAPCSVGDIPEVVCAVSHREVQCSENGDSSSFPVGLGYEQNASSGLAVVDGQLILASGAGSTD